MGEKKVTIMVLKVDLQCEKCYKKVKKVLCKFPQIRDQTYDEKNNQVIIKVICCSPEKIRDKLCCKGGGAITRIDILTKESPSPPPPPPPPQVPAYPPVTMNVCCIVCYGWHPGCPCQIRVVPPNPPVTGSTCCMDCYEGHPGGPCQTGYGYGGPAPSIQYDDYFQACAIM